MEVFKRNIGTFQDDFEGDDFYDELRRQILILTAEDEEDYVQQSNDQIKNSKRVEMNSLELQQPKGIQFYWYGDKEDYNKVPKWLLDLWRKGNRDEVLNGTGVFIPHIVKSRRRNKSRRKNSERVKTYKPVASGNC
ncbi:uncharacterized protein LOC129879977 [Solanum dulcamara]|uniref:uncharacterized protein LOC129879977 n=1 Tax=Solanum dulcamara TaxID=45834 RepID=UPI002485ECD4|nr:uncharacterized protein LOC129879977 [Solanum dulcamara]